jgi:hypothetical protein
MAESKSVSYVKQKIDTVCVYYIHLYLMVIFPAFQVCIIWLIIYSIKLLVLVERDGEIIVQ